MGTDIYRCEVESHLVLSKSEAIARAVAYGHAPESPPQAIAGHGGPFLEVTLSMRSVYFDAPVAWDPLMLLRLLDEAVCAAAYHDKSGFGFENSPISRCFPGIWGMSFRPERPLSEHVHVVQIERTPPPAGAGPNRDWSGDRARVVFFVPEHLAPNLSGVGTFDSRAWGGRSWDEERQLAEERPWLAEARLAEASARLREAPRRGTSVLKPMHQPALAARSAGGLWLVNAMELFHLDPGSLALRLVCALPSPHRNTSATVALEDGQGALWIGLNKGLIRYHPDSGPSLEASGHAGKEIHDLGLTPEGRIVVAGVGGVWIQGADRAFEHVREGLLDTTVDRVIVGSDGVIWAAGSKGLTRRDPDGALVRYQKTQGVGSSPRLLPLPDGGLYVSSYGGGGWIRRGGARVEPHPTLDGALPRGLQHGALGPDGVAVALTPQGLLVRLAEGEPARAFAFGSPLGDRWGQRILPVEGGDLWWMLRDGVARFSAADRARAEALPALIPRAVPGMRFGGPEKEAARIDFNRKIVVLTGTFSRMSRDEASAWLSARGAIVGSGVTAKTDYLIAGKGAGSKAAKAAKLGVIVLDEDALSP